MAGSRKAKKSATPESGTGKGKKSYTPISAKGKSRSTMRKTKLLNEIIDISSSCNGSAFNLNMKDGGDINSLASSPDVKINYAYISNDEEEKCKHASGVEELKAAFTNIANLILGSNPNLRFTLSPSGLPVITSNPPTPSASPNTEKIMAKFNSQAKIDTNSAQKQKQTIGLGGQKWEPSQDNHIKRNLFTKYDEGNDNNYYINFEPLTTCGYEGRTKGAVIPEWIHVSFRPPAEMILDDIDAAVAAYVFMSDEENRRGKEILVKTTFGVGDRNTFKTLMPKGWVLNMLACRMTHIEKMLGIELTTWFLPTMFTQFVLDLGYKARTVREFFQDNFMGKVEYVRKIFIPINDENVHWYLMVVDFNERKVLLLDSLPCPERSFYRRIKVQKLALTLQEMLMHKSFYDENSRSQFNHIISTFPLVEPVGLGVQQKGSNDCGVWVAKWMKECTWHDNYDKIVVRPSTRMRIVLNLVMHTYNQLKDNVLEKAFEHWTEMEKRRKELVRI